jgi:hypothetical protein
MHHRYVNDVGSGPSHTGLDPDHWGGSGPQVLLPLRWATNFFYYFFFLGRMTYFSACVIVFLSCGPVGWGGGGCVCGGGGAALSPQGRRVCVFVLVLVAVCGRWVGEACCCGGCGYFRRGLRWLRLWFWGWGSGTETRVCDGC